MGISFKADSMIFNSKLIVLILAFISCLEL